MRIIAGRARSRVIEAPTGRDTRPTLDRVRENMFNILSRRVVDAQVLDLFSGSGALALEAISRGAQFAVLVDHDKQATQVEKRNIQKLNFQEQTRVISADWQEAVLQLAREERRFDLIFLDPPYAMLDLRPVTGLLQPLLQQEGLLVLEHEAKNIPLVSDGFRLTDTRKYGYAGLSFFEWGEG